MSKFGLPCWETFDCLSGWGVGGGNYTGGTAAGSFQFPTFTPYNGGQNTVIGGGGNSNTTTNTQEVNQLQNVPVKNNTDVQPQQQIITLDIFSQIKTLIQENQLIALAGAALFVYLLTKRK